MNSLCEMKSRLNSSRIVIIIKSVSLQQSEQ